MRHVCGDGNDTLVCGPLPCYVRAGFDRHNAQACSIVNPHRVPRHDTCPHYRVHSGRRSLRDRETTTIHSSLHGPESPLGPFQISNARYVELLERLKEMKTHGKIAKEIYLKLKDEYWKKLGQGAPALEPLCCCISCGRHLMRESVYCEYCGARQLE
jgi:hypothetical protein